VQTVTQLPHAMPRGLLAGTHRPRRAAAHELLENFQAVGVGKGLEGLRQAFGVMDSIVRHFSNYRGF
jgi:hypothetical protein